MKKQQTLASKWEKADLKKGYFTDELHKDIFLFQEKLSSRTNGSETKTSKIVPMRSPHIAKNIHKNKFK